jgi:hypothetical protein
LNSFIKIIKISEANLLNNIPSKSLKIFVQDLILSDPLSEFYYRIIKTNETFYLFFVENNIHEKFTICHSFSLDNTDKKCNEFAYDSIPLSIAVLFAESMKYLSFLIN